MQKKERKVTLPLKKSFKFVNYSLIIPLRLSSKKQSLGEGF